MLEHNPFPPKAEEVTGDMTIGDARVEAYLDTLCAQLSETLTEEQKQAYRAEIREHLEALIESHRELGALPEEAVKSALHQFGDAHRVADVWEQVAEPHRPVSLREALRAPGCWFGGAMLLYTVMFLAARSISRSSGPLPPDVMDSLLMLWVLWLPLLGGMATGWTTRGRPVLGTLLALPPLHLALMLFYYLTFGAWHIGIAQSVLIQLTYWSLFGAGVASLTHKIRRWWRRQGPKALA